MHQSWCDGARTSDTTCHPRAALRLSEFLVGIQVVVRIVTTQAARFGVGFGIAFTGSARVVLTLVASSAASNYTVVGFSLGGAVR